jgi:uncharacterized protein
MTPQERQLIDDLFDRLTKLESVPRDPDAERAIADGLQRAPHAIYALVQTVLVQDEALRRADARIRELSGEDDAQAPRQGGSFLDTMRSALGGGRSGGSVPNVRQQQAQPGPDPRWNTGGAVPGGAPAPGPGYGAAHGYGAAPQPAPFGAAPSAGGSFLGTAAASAVGAIGGAMLFNSIGGLFGKHEGGSAFGSQQAFGSPWDNNASGGDLARDAGFNDVGGVNDPQAAGFFGNNDDVTEVDETDYVDNSDDFGNDNGGTEDV